MIHRPVKKKGGTSAGLPKESRPRSPGTVGAAGNMVSLSTNSLIAFCSRPCALCVFSLLDVSRVACFWYDHECDLSEEKANAHPPDNLCIPPLPNTNHATPTLHTTPSYPPICICHPSSPVQLFTSINHAVSELQSPS